MAGCREDDNESSVSIKGKEFLSYTACIMRVRMHPIYVWKGAQMINLAINNLPILLLIALSL